LFKTFKTHTRVLFCFLARFVFENPITQASAVRNWICIIFVSTILQIRDETKQITSEFKRVGAFRAMIYIRAISNEIVIVNYYYYIIADHPAMVDRTV